MSEAPERIWIDRVWGRHPEDWGFFIGANLTKKQKAGKVEYIRADLALPAERPDAVIRAERDRCIRIVEQLQKEAAERGWGDRDTQTRRIVSAIRHEIVGEALPAVQPDAGPKPFDCECGQVGPCKAPFCTPRSAQSHVNETPKSEHDAANMLTPATKGANDD